MVILSQAAGHREDTSDGIVDVEFAALFQENDRGGGELLGDRTQRNFVLGVLGIPFEIAEPKASSRMTV